MSIRGVIFDLDGTLINSVDDIADSLNYTLKQHGLDERPNNNIKDWIGEGAIELIRKAIPADKLVHLEVEKFLWEYRERYRQNYAEKTYLYNGISSLLDALTARNLYLNILSNKPQELTLLVAQHFFSEWKFKNILGMRDSIPRKPDPYAALEIVQNLGVKPSEILYVGDSGTDIETARNARLKIVAVSWGFRPRFELENLNADFIIDQPLELLHIIDSI
jgi:phosphoglycolate phosphatase